MTARPHPHPRVIGHRGASGYRPEHTAAAYALAFELGADAVEPDVVLSRDGVPVVRHENEISGTTDVADHPGFRHRRTTKEVDGQSLTGWFTEDFTWAELQTLRAKERLPHLRSQSAEFDGRFGLLRLSDLLALVDEAAVGAARPLGAVVELKHASYFDSIGLPLAEIVTGELRDAGWRARGDQLVVESFEKTVLQQVRDTGLGAQFVYLLEAHGAPYDEVVRHGGAARPYASELTNEGLAALARLVDGISVDKAVIQPLDDRGDASGTSDLVGRAHEAGLRVFTWTLRAENAFLPANRRSGPSEADLGDWMREFSDILSSGVDGVFADQPDLAVAARLSVGGAA